MGKQQQSKFLSRAAISLQNGVTKILSGRWLTVQLICSRESVAARNESNLRSTLMQLQSGSPDYMRKRNDKHEKSWKN